MEPVVIIANQSNIIIGQQFPTPITSLEIIVSPIATQVLVDYNQALLIKQWLRGLIEHTTAEYITYNDTLIATSELKEQHDISPNTEINN